MSEQTCIFVNVQATVWFQLPIVGQNSVGVGLGVSVGNEVLVMICVDVEECEVVVDKTTENSRMFEEVNMFSVV